MSIAAELLDEYERLGPKGGSPMKRVLQQGREDPRFFEALVIDSLHRPLPRATFLDAALDLLDDAAYARTTSEAWRRFRLGHRGAGLSRVLRSAMLQRPDVFADDWECLLRAQVHGADDLDGHDAWHALDESTARQWLGWTTAAGMDDPLARARATALLHCEHRQVVQDAWHRLAPDPTTSSARVTLMSAGFTMEDGRLRRLHDPVPRHLLLGADQWEQMLAGQADWKRDIWRAQSSWRPDGPVAAGVRMGGALAGTCGLCHQPLHRLLALEDAAGAPFEHAGPLTLATCLSCQGWEEQVLLFEHGVDGQARPHRSQRREMPLAPQFPSPALQEAEVGLFAASPRWARQDWGAANDRQNLNRLGGAPAWVQGAQHPDCPDCRRTMRFVMQLDSGLPLHNGDEWLWGSGGCNYSFWCDHCQVSGHLWQCT